MRIVIGADHGGFNLKEALKTFLADEHHEIIDVGCSSTNSVDYPDFAEKAVHAFNEKLCDFGILICGTGIGMSIAANRHREIRAANCHTKQLTVLSREHNNANFLCLGARVIDEALALELVDVWLKSEFTGGRHQRRIEKFSDLSA
ncbi:ribose 5-phosphate isomerase B [Desulfomarina sp.]